MSTDTSRALAAAFGQAVRQQRRMRLDDLSSASRLPRGRKMSARCIGRIEAGEVDTHYDELIALADVLGVTAGQLIGDAEQL
jgi:hypothetical protein